MMLHNRFGASAGSHEKYAYQAPALAQNMLLLKKRCRPWLPASTPGSETKVGAPLPPPAETTPWSAGALVMSAAADAGRRKRDAAEIDHLSTTDHEESPRTAPLRRGVGCPDQPVAGR